MAKSSKRYRRTILLLSVYGLFLLLWVAPKSVWCHRSDLRVEIETETILGECPCEKCAHCREHRVFDPVIRAIPCVHEEIDTAAGKEAAPKSRKFEVAAVSACPIGYLVAAIRDAAGRPVPPGLAAIFKPPPPSRPCLRC